MCGSPLSIGLGDMSTANIDISSGAGLLKLLGQPSSRRVSLLENLEARVAFSWFLALAAHLSIPMDFRSTYHIVFTRSIR